MSLQERKKDWETLLTSEKKRATLILTPPPRPSPGVPTQHRGRALRALQGRLLRRPRPWHARRLPAVRVPPGPRCQPLHAPLRARPGPRRVQVPVPRRVRGPQMRDVGRGLCCSLSFCLFVYRFIGWFSIFFYQLWIYYEFYSIWLVINMFVNSYGCLFLICLLISFFTMHLFCFCLLSRIPFICLLIWLIFLSS